MITHQEIKNLESEWGLNEAVIEKDYVLGWVLWGIGTEPDLMNTWAFKGGTSLKKCFIETWRFSEDLDFTIYPNGLVSPDELKEVLPRIFERVHEESGIHFETNNTKFKYFDLHQSTQVVIYYRGPRNARNLAKIKFDLSRIEKIVRPTVLRPISHAYSDTLPGPAQIRSYAFEEVFAEKLRAMGERGRPRDLYDIVLLFRRRDLQAEPKLIKETLIEKCKSKQVPLPSYESISSADHKEELIAEWENMLGHQLQVLPPFEDFWNELPNIFSWLNGEAQPKELAPIGSNQDEDLSWSPPLTIWQWGLGIPLESIRFAAINHLCVELGYKGSNRLIEPYSLRKTKEGNLILHALRADDGESRSYRVDRIDRIKVSNQAFVPKFKIEFSGTGEVQAPPTQRKNEYGLQNFNPSVSSHKTRRRSPSNPYGMKYVFQCPNCMKHFTKSKHDTKLRKHKNTYGTQCSGRSGYFVGNK